VFEAAVIEKIEAYVYDFCSIINQMITNVVLGHGTSAFGAMTADEVIRKYQAATTTTTINPHWISTTS